MVLDVIYLMDKKLKTKRKIFGEISSAAQSEFFKAGQIGTKAQFKVKAWATDYKNEPIAELQGEKYAIYRSYMLENGKVELYLSEKGGVV